MLADAQTRDEVLALLHRQLAAYQAKDLEGVMQCYLPGDAVIAYGTNLDQKVVGHSAVRQAFLDDFDGFEAASLEITWCQVCALGEVAWVASDCEAAMEVDGETYRTKARATTVLLKQDGAWRIAQSHLSFPADTSGMAGPAVVL